MTDPLLETVLSDIERIEADTTDTAQLSRGIERTTEENVGSDRRRCEREIWSRGHNQWLRACIYLVF